MADSDIQITAGSGTKVDTRTVGTGADEHRQVIVIGDPTTAANVSSVDSNGSLGTLRRADLQRISVASAGLTTATTTYTAGDQVGTLFTISNAARFTGGGGIITGITVIDASDVIGPLDLVIFDSSVTLAGDNAVFAISDADALDVVAVVQLIGGIDIGNNRIAQAVNLAVPYICNGGTSLYASIITRTANAVFAAGATSVQLTIYVERY